MRIGVLVFGLVMLALVLSGARADVVTLPPQGYTEVEEYGDVELGTSYRTPDGIPFEAGMDPSFGITSHGVGWAPTDVPVYLEVGRDARGRWIFLSSLIRENGRAVGCWSETEITEREAASADRLWRLIERRARDWARRCAAAATFGPAAIAGQLRAARADFAPALQRFVATRTQDYVPSDREFGVPSFLPTRVSQSLLDAVADGCGLPRANLTLGADGAIDARVTGSEGRVEMCVLDSVRYFPGFKPE